MRRVCDGNPRPRIPISGACVVIPWITRIVSDANFPSIVVVNIISVVSRVIKTMRGVSARARGFRIEGVMRFSDVYFGHFHSFRVLNGLGMQRSYKR